MATSPSPAPLAVELDHPEATKPAVGPQHRAFTSFFFWFFLFPVLAYLAAFPLVRSASYEHWSRSQWGPMLDFAFNTGHQNADVVIFGDSSAFIGIDPRLVDAQLGIKTVVLPGTIGSLPITDDLALRRYLQTNKAPRLIVFYFSAWNLDFRNVDNIRPFEGDEMMLRHGSSGEVAKFAWHQPMDVLVFPLRLYSTFGPGMLRSMVRHEDRERATAEALGHVADYDPFPALTDACRLPARLTTPGSDATIRALARAYRTPTTDVMVYLAPVPGCQNASALAARSFAALGAAPPAVLPAREFLGDPNFAHLFPKFVGTSSSLFATSLETRLEQLARHSISGVQAQGLRAR